MVRVTAARHRGVNNNRDHVTESRVYRTPTLDGTIVHSGIVVSVEMLKGSSCYLDAVLNSDSFDQVAAQVLGTDFVDEVNEFRKAKASRCSSR